MLLQLDDKFRVTTDSSLQNFILEKYTEIIDRKSKDSKHDWQIVGYFGGNFTSVLLRYVNETIKLESKSND